LLREQAIELPEPVAAPVDGDDVDVVQQAVEDRGGEDLIAGEDFGPVSGFTSTSEPWLRTAGSAGCAKAIMGSTYCPGYGQPFLKHHHRASLVHPL
jgi:hypothetical protein